jgi:hypothetical protein
MAALRHPNIVGFLGVCPTPPCVVSDFCSRGSLADVLGAAKKSPVKAAQLDWVRRLNMVRGWCLKTVSEEQNIWDGATVFQDRFQNMQAAPAGMRAGPV